MTALQPAAADGFIIPLKNNSDCDRREPLERYLLHASILGDGGMNDKELR